MEFVKMFVNAVALAAGRPIVEHVGGIDRIDFAILTRLVKTEVRANLDRLMVEWEDASQAIVSENTLKGFVNAQAAEIAESVIGVYHTEMAWKD